MPTIGDLTRCPDSVSTTGAATGAATAAAMGGGAIICGAGAMACMTGAVCRLILTDSSPSLISSSAMPDSSRSSINFFILRAETADNTDGNIGQIGMFPEVFARVDIGQVKFDKG